MSTLQTLLALVVLIYVLCVIVQAVQEILKSLLGTKAATLKQMIVKFMCDHLTLPQVEGALGQRGLDITALENLNRDDFRMLLNGIQLENNQLQGLVANAQATMDQARDHIAAAYEAGRASFQKAYTQKNKMFALIISFVIVLILNASVIRLYEILSANQSMSQAIAGTASTMLSPKQPDKAGGASQSPDLAEVYARNRKTIEEDLQSYPILLRTCKYSEDFGKEPANEIIGLVVMGFLVSLGAPFWNDVLKGVTGVNNALNAGGKKGP